MKRKNSPVCNRWLEYEDDILREIYGKVKIEEVLKRLPRHTWGSTHKRVKKLGLKGNPRLAAKIYNIDENFFSELNRESCYWAGFIAADGCVVDESCVSIGLALKDKDHLLKFVNAVGYNGKIKEGSVLNKSGSRSYYCRVYFWGVKKWVTDLKRLFKIGPRKTFTLESPDGLNNEQSLCYIAGYLDGDGSIRLNVLKRKCGYCPIKPLKSQLLISFAGTNSTLEWIRKVINENCPRIDGKQSRIFLCNNFPCINFHGYKAFDVGGIIMKNATEKFLMERKWNRLKQVA